jgi:ABC-type thiamine transport system ATPase subunit
LGAPPVLVDHTADVDAIHHAGGAVRGIENFKMFGMVNLLTNGGPGSTTEPPATRDIAFVFQQYSLYPHLSLYDNLAFPLRSPMHCESKEMIRQKVKKVANLLHIESKLHIRATALSGGQMQRVAIGRALVRSPSIFLMDEPLSSLDAKLRSELRLELKCIQQEMGSIILYVTHDQTDAMITASPSPRRLAHCERNNELNGLVSHHHCRSCTWEIPTLTKQVPNVYPSPDGEIRAGRLSGQGPDHDCCCYPE